MFLPRSVLIIDRDAETLQAARDVLEEEPDIQVAGSLPDGDEALEAIQNLGAAIVLLGPGIPSERALNVLWEIRRESRPRGVIFWTGGMSREDILDAMTLNVDGLVRHSEPLVHLLQCLDAVLNDEQYLSPLMREIAEGRATADGRLVEDPLRVLTDREKEIALEAAKGGSREQVAEALGIRPNTLKMHLHRIQARLKVRDRDGLARLVARRPAHLANSRGGSGEANAR